MHLLPINEQKVIEKYSQFIETKLTPRHSLIEKYKHLNDDILKSIHTKSTDSL